MHARPTRAYLRMLDAGVAREVARGVLPVSIYSSMYVTMNARSLMNFLSLRTKREGSHFPSFPQREIEMVAEQMEAEWARLMPLTHAAFEANGRVVAVTAGCGPAGRVTSSHARPTPGRARSAGVLTAMVTPFRADGALDLDGAQRLADAPRRRRATTAWWSPAPPASRRPPPTPRRTRSCAPSLEAVGDRATVVAGVGTNDTAPLGRAGPGGREGRRARRCWSSRPYYNKPPQAGLVAHFTAVADATDLPVMLYDIPQRTGVPIEPETLLRARRAPADRRGQGRQGRPRRRRRAVMAGTGLAYYSGDDASTCRCSRVGAVGVVSVVGHVVGAADRARWSQAYEAGDVARRRELHRAAAACRTSASSAPRASITDQGRAAASSGCRPARCGCRWSTPPTSEVAQLVARPGRRPASTGSPHDATRQSDAAAAAPARRRRRCASSRSAGSARSAAT